LNPGRFLANENTPGAAVRAARQAGHDVAWMVELQPGAPDPIVLQIAQKESRVLLTFDKDFGELVFRKGRAASWGVILLRPRLRSPQVVSDFVLTVLEQPFDWPGYFTVAREGSLRMIPLP
jgi:predicted nuclease of predicted toxin-antitoxin system